MKLAQYVSGNEPQAINSSLDAIFAALLGVVKVDVVSGITAQASGAFTVNHKLGRKPEFFIPLPESDCRFEWTADDKRITSDKILVAHATAASVPFVALVMSRFE